MKKLRIGLFGFGVVGEGIYQVLSEKHGLDCEIIKICIKDSSKSRNAPDHLFTIDPQELLKDDTINVIVELINDPEAAFKIVVEAMRLGKSVVSANKKMIADNQITLIQLQRKYQTSFLYEAAVCGSIPILRNLEEYFDNDLLKYVTGVVNGSTNYILTQMEKKNISFNKSLKDAQKKGFAETDPSLDIDGLDASFKLSIICLHAFGKVVKSRDILRKGIGSIRPADLNYAREKGLKIKLIANSNENSEGVCATIFPTFLREDDTLSLVENEYNGVLIGSSLADEQFLYGKGAGRYPTSSAVLSDISALRYHYKYELKKGSEKSTASFKEKRKFYISFDRKNSIDFNFFDTIEEHYINGEIEYVIGQISLEKMQQLDVWKEMDVSIIAFG